MYGKLFTAIILILLPFLKAEAFTVPNSSVLTFTPEQRSDKTESVWIRPYSSFETVELENKHIVHNNGYGTFVGYDSDVFELNADWETVLTFYTGYNGARQKHDASTIIQNGGQLGLSGVLFKRNFFTGIAANIGSTGAEINNSDTKINFHMLTTTAAVKTGYNFDFFEKKLTLQPSFLCAYIFVNTFDYVNADNITVKSEPVHSIQLMPGLKLTGNLPNGWQPYFGVQQVWNLMNDSNFSANDASVGEISVKPYIQYGFGVQKSAGESFSGYIQSTLRNGGREGIILSFGLRKYF